MHIDSKNMIENFHEVFGKECLWGTTDEVWQDANDHPEKYLPRGSEGSLKMESRLMTRARNSKYPYRYRIRIYGSLRDFTSWERIYFWITMSYKNLSHIKNIQTKIELTAECDCMGTYTWSHTDYGYKDPFFYKSE